MKSKWILSAACLLMMAACGPKPVSLLSDEGTKIHGSNASLVENTPTTVVMKNVGGGNNGFAIYPASPDWSAYKALRWTVENKSDRPVSLWVRVLEKGVGDPGNAVKKGVLFHKYMVEPQSSRTITMEFPAPAPHPEVLNDFRVMRNNPYGRLTGFHSTEIDYANVEKVTFFNTRSYKDAEWVVSDVELIPGEKKLPEAMKLTAEEFFPFIDKYGQFKYAEWPGKVHSDADMQKAREVEEKDLAANPGPEGWSKYGGWVAGPKFEATGHFRVEKIDGKWWMIDPEGYLFWSHGVVRVSHSSAVTPLEGKNIPNRCHYFEDLPAEGTEFAPFYRTYDALLKPYYTARDIDSTYDFSSANLYRKYGPDYLAAFGDICHRRLRSWGMNTIANSSDKDICLMDRTPYTDRFEVVSAPIAGTRGWWPVMDPFDKSFNASIEKQLIDRKNELEDPWCLGFFVDNEIAWGNETHLAEVVLKTPATQAAKKQFVSDLKAKYRTIAALNKAWGSSFASWDALLQNDKDIKTSKKNKEDLLAFNRSLIHKYYSNIREAFDKLAPGVLYMGCRFSNYTPDLVTIGAQYCDVISYNRYAFTTDSVVLPDGVDKPVMIGEFHFGALDRGMFHCSQVEVESQEKRGEAYVRYVESALRHPQIIGTHWHQYSDQATTGRFDGEDFQVGFTDVCDTPYPETIAGIRKVGYNLYEYRKNN
ncbi:MAG: beta-galactosidase [Bacteroidales bacterium]|nr:beta-galactosidase [Bacteroidales bacterium]